MLIYRLQYKDTGLGPFTTNVVYMRWYDHMGPNDEPNAEIFRKWLDEYHSDFNTKDVPSFIKFGCDSLKTLNKFFPLWKSLDIYEVVEIFIPDDDLGSYVILTQGQVAYHKRYEGMKI